MSRNSSGTYTLPLPPVIPDTTIESVWSNTSLDDIAQALTDSLDRYGRGAMVAPLRFVDGNVGAPGIAWQSETTTGFYRESAGVMSVAIQGVKVAQWSSAGVSLLAPVSGTSATFSGNVKSGSVVSVFPQYPQELSGPTSYVEDSRPRFDSLRHQLQCLSAPAAKVKLKVWFQVCPSEAVQK